MNGRRAGGRRGVEGPGGATTTTPGAHAGAGAGEGPPSRVPPSGSPAEIPSPPALLPNHSGIDLDGLDFEDKAALAEIEAEELKLLERYPLRFWVPNGKQEEFLELVAGYDLRSGEIVVYHLSAGNGMGKSALVAAMLATLLRGVQSEWFDRPFWRDFPRPCKLRLTTSKTAAKEGVLADLRRFIEPWLVEEPRAENFTWPHLWRVYGEGGEINQLRVFTWSQPLTEHAGAACDAHFADEPGPESVWQEDLERLRHGGPAVIVGTPVDENGGVGKNTAWLFHGEHQDEPGETKIWHTVYADMEDNCIEHGVRGRIPHARVENTRRRLMMGDPAVFKARFGGRHAMELGRVLQEWDRGRHLFNPEDLVVSGWEVYAHLDTHEARPHVFVLGVLDPFDVFWVCHELVSGAPPDQLAREIKQLYAIYGTPVRALIDPFGTKSNPLKPGDSLQAALGRLGVKLQSAGKEKAEKAIGIAKVRERLRGILSPLGEKVPLLKVSSDCALVISQAERWMVDPKTGEAMKQHDDTWEGIYRIVNTLPRVRRGTAGIVNRHADEYTSSLVAP